jgi:hypothetical protein
MNPDKSDKLKKLNTKQIKRIRSILLGSGGIDPISFDDLHP